MDNQPASIDFALIGHQETWEKIIRYVRQLRVVDTDRELTDEEIKNIFPFIPPRVLFDIKVNGPENKLVSGVYIETFISPDELGSGFIHKNIIKVRNACQVAANIGAGIGALGGLTSIVLESGNQFFEKIGNTFFTTGNTLTTGFIIEGVKKACLQREMNLKNCSVLVVGSTGDIGSACVKALSNQVKQLNLCARIISPLQKQASQLNGEGQSSVYTTNINDLLPQTDILIAVASSIIENADLSLLPANSIICDAGYPKNITSITNTHQVFYGGMGIVKEGYQILPEINQVLYDQPLKNMAHGCLLEAIALSLANQRYSFSKGRGNITTQNMQTIISIAEQQGIVLAPLFNNHLTW